MRRIRGQPPHTLSVLLVVVLLGCHACGHLGGAHIRANNTSSSSSSSSCGADSKPASDTKIELEVKRVHGDYIASLSEYLAPKSAEHAVEEILHHASPPDAWSVVPRHNPAMEYPTDFVVVRISDASHEAGILAALRGSPRIRSVVPERRVTRHLRHMREDDKGEKDAERGMMADGSEDGTDEEHAMPPRTGRHLTKWSWFCSNCDKKSEEAAAEQERLRTAAVREPTLRRKLLEKPSPSITSALHAEALWDEGYSGRGIRVAVFDTGLRKDHPHFRNIKERTNWTDEDSLDDGIGHGSFVAGVIASSMDCLGFAPDADLYIFRVFTNKQVSFTSWFLDAFNYAIHTKVHIINLSIGGPDFMDKPFVDKVNEITANQIIMVSAIGNDGPLYGTLNNPADQNNVIGVGGINYDDEVAAFSSRGMTTWELPHGYGRFKPDVVSYGASVRGSQVKSGCRTLSGTSVASPVVAGAVALLASTVDEPYRARIVNPASMKQALIETAIRIPNANIFEQGQGKLNLTGAGQFLQTYVPHASTVPAAFDTTQCPYMWPYCEQDIFYGGAPVIANLTILNGMGVTGWLTEPPQWRPLTDGNGDMLDVSIEHSDVLWPWSGYLALRVAASEAAQSFSGIAEGVVTFTVISPTTSAGVFPSPVLKSFVSVPVRVSIAPTPPRSKRILWDQYHSLPYPPGYFPRDNLAVKSDPLDWNADHPHTNFRSFYQHMREQGYFIDILGAPFTCFDARDYGTLIIVDNEEEFFQEEIDKLEHDVNALGLSVLVIADWYNVEVMKVIKFFDENTQNWWFPETGGANIPALNEVLGRWGIGFSTSIYEGSFRFQTNQATYQSGTTLDRFPAGGLIISAQLRHQGKEILKQSPTVDRVPIIGFVESSKAMKGRIAVFGDSNCLDDSHSQKGARCLWLADIMLAFTETGEIPSALRNVAQVLEDPLVPPLSQIPQRSLESTLHLYSSVLRDQHTKRPVPMCPQIAWAFPQPLRDEDDLRTLKRANERHATYNADLLHASIQRRSLVDARASDPLLSSASDSTSSFDVGSGGNVFFYLIVFAIIALSVGALIVGRPRNRSLQYSVPNV